MKRHHKSCRRFNDVGHAHSLTFSCFRRQPFLSRDRSRRWLAAAIAKACLKQRYHLWAYVIMPEHVHLLVFPTERNYRISSLLQSVKTSVARTAIPFVKKHAPSFLPKLLDRQPNGDEHYRFWQRGGGYDRNITEPRTVWLEIDYIHANPVRRGLCERPEDWKWSSAPFYAGVECDSLEIETSMLPRSSKG